MKHVESAGCITEVAPGELSRCPKCQTIGAASYSSCVPEVKTGEHESFCGECGVNLVMLILTFLLSMQFGAVVGLFLLCLR